MLSRRRTERGAAAILVALVTCVVLFVVAALTVDIGNSWARRGQLQFQVDRAAKFAAEQLPVDTTTVTTSPSTTQLAAARAAAYHLACHAVPGQDDLMSLPSCPAAGVDYTADSGIRAFALTLLSGGRTGNTSQGAVTFPTVNQVKVTAPDAWVDFGFGGIVGADGHRTSMSATAIVLSPGEVVPIGMSLSCAANALGTAPLGAGDTASTVMPINYVSTGSGSFTSTPTVVTNTYSGSQAYWGDITDPNAATISLLSSSINTASGLVTLSFSWASGRTGWTVTGREIFIRKVGSTTASGTYSGTYVPAVTTSPVTVSYLLAPGSYEALIRIHGYNTNPLNEQTWVNNINQVAKFTVPDIGKLSHYVACARPAQSPRLGITSDSDAMSVNIAQGIDHGLQAFPGLVDAVDNVHIGVGSGTAVSSAATLLASGGISALTCGTSSSVKKDYPTRRTDGPNCVRVDTNTDWSSAVTQGLLTGGTFATGSVNGRLKCPTSGSCNFKSTRATLSNPGGISGTYNDDHFADFVKPSASYLDDPFLMALDSLISPTVPLVTPPNSVLDTAIYDSPRFFWAPYVVSAWPSSPGAADYSVLTFRPVFLTSDTSSTAATKVDSLLLSLITTAVSGGLTLSQTLSALGASSACLALGTTACEKQLLATSDISTLVSTFLGSNNVVAGGMVIDSSAGLVRAARLMTLVPGALPAPPPTYHGPTTDYLGVGPKIIRLTK